MSENVRDFYGQSVRKEWRRLVRDAYHGLECVGSGHPREINRLANSPARWKVGMETHLAACTHPPVVGLSEHVSVVCRKKA